MWNTTLTALRTVTPFWRQLRRRGTYLAGRAGTSWCLWTVDSQPGYRRLRTLFTDIYLRRRANARDRYPGGARGTLANRDRHHFRSVALLRGLVAPAGVARRQSWSP